MGRIIYFIVKHLPQLAVQNVWLGPAPGLVYVLETECQTPLTGNEWDCKKDSSTIQEKLISFSNHVILLVCLLNVGTILKVKGALDVRGNKYAGEQINTVEAPVINKVRMYTDSSENKLFFHLNRHLFLLNLCAGFMSQTLSPLLKGNSHWDQEGVFSK